MKHGKNFFCTAEKVWETATVHLAIADPTDTVPIRLHGFRPCTFSRFFYSAVQPLLYLHTEKKNIKKVRGDIFMSTHFLDIKGKIADLQAILHEYKEELSQAERKNDTANIKRLERLIEETENKIDGMRNSPYYNG